VFGRAADTGSEFGWKITVGDDQWDRESVTIAELAEAERHTGVSYLNLNPIQYADHLVALIVAHLHRVNGMKIEAAIAQAEKYKSADLESIVSIREVKAAPKVGPSTSTA
jgi:hypothetical protein